ncbi:MAG: MFS transporter [Chlamydiae bacterium]|nr:MFS transporter [Chlamydiota bacterium]
MQKGNFELMGLCLSFHALNICQFLITLNDAIARMLVIFFLNDLVGIASVNTTLFLTSLVIVVPFLVFSMLGGALADRYPKGIMIQWLQLVSIAGAVMIWVSMLEANGFFVYLGLFFMALQAALFSPARLAIVPEIVEGEKIPFANSILTASNYIALLFGAFVASYMTIITKRDFSILGLILVAISVFAGLASIFVRSSRSFQDKKIDWNFIRTTIFYLKETVSIPHLLHVIIYGSYFLLACLFTQLNLIPLGYQELNITDAQTGYILLYTSLGLGIGSLFYGLVSKKNIEVSYALIGGLGTALSYYGIVICPHNFFAVSVMGFLIGISGGFFIVPLNGFIQTRSPEPIRASILAASNTLGFVFLLLGAAFLEISGGYFKLSAHTNFVLLAALTLFMWFLFAYEFRYALFRPVFVLIINLFYRVESRISPSKQYTLKENSLLGLMGLMSLFEPLLVIKNTSHPSRGFKRLLNMFLSIKELDLEKEPQVLEEVKKGMNLEGGMIIFLEYKIEAAPVIQFQKKGRHLKYF